MKKQTVTNLLLSGVFICVLLTGCAGEKAAGNHLSGEEAAGTQDLEVNMASMAEEAGEKQALTESEEKMDFAGAKELLGSFPNSREELTALEVEYPIYMLLHGIQDSGEEKLQEFKSKLEAGEASELIVVQFTVEGDAILDYYCYDGSLLYRWEDISRDAFGGGGEKYFETIYESAWFTGEADTEGNSYLSFYGLCEGDMVVELFRAGICKLPLAK